jgi:hypothetical protein
VVSLLQTFLFKTLYALLISVYVLRAIFKSSISSSE